VGVQLFDRLLVVIDNRPRGDGDRDLARLEWRKPADVNLRDRIARQEQRQMGQSVRPARDRPGAGSADGRRWVTHDFGATTGERASVHLPLPVSRLTRLRRSNAWLDPHSLKSRHVLTPEHQRRALRTKVAHNVDALKQLTVLPREEQDRWRGRQVFVGLRRIGVGLLARLIFQEQQNRAAEAGQQVSTAALHRDEQAPFGQNFQLRRIVRQRLVGAVVLQDQDVPKASDQIQLRIVAMGNFAGRMDRAFRKRPWSAVDHVAPVRGALEQLLQRAE
jgi:hypothetical protein